MAENEDNIIDINNPEHQSGVFDFVQERNFVTDAGNALGLETNIKDIIQFEQDKANSFNPPDAVVTTSAPEPEVEEAETEETTEEVAEQQTSETEETSTAEPEAEAQAEKPEPVAEEKPEPVAEEKPEPQKYKLHGREFTEEELNELVNKALAPQPEQKAAEPEKEEAPPEPTAEEIAEAETKFIQTLSDNITTDHLVSEKDVEDILVGGDEARERLQQFAKNLTALAVLETRKSIFAELNPVLADISNKVTPVLQQTQDLEKYQMTQMFTQRHPEYAEAGQMDLAAEIATQLQQQYPKEVQAMSREQFADEVARQADKVVDQEFKRWYPNSEGSWKDHLKSKSQPEPEPVVEKPAEEPAAPAPVAKKAPKPKPPATSSPRIVGGQPEDWHKKTASSLV